VAAIKSYISGAGPRESLEFYLDLHAHANKRGVFAYGNALKGADHIETLAYCRWGPARPWPDDASCGISRIPSLPVQGHVLPPAYCVTHLFGLMFGLPSPCFASTSVVSAEFRWFVGCAACCIPHRGTVKLNHRAHGVL
jgi:hypothetical protein